MRSAVSVVLLLVVGAGLVHVVRKQGLDRLIQGTRLGAPPTPVATAWKTEEEWLAGEIARDIAEIAFFAASRRAPAAGEIDARASVTGAAGKSPIRVTVAAKGAPERMVDLPLTFIWDPSAYLPVVQLAPVVPSVAASPAATGPGDGVLHALTEPTVGVVEDANRRVSATLAGNPRLSAAHESAALVLAALAMREAAGLSHDIRPALCRMTAHLALAEAWREGAPTVEGRVAQAALLVLAGRGADAEAAINSLPAARPAERAWRDALFVRLTDDGRRVPDPQRATLLERMAYVRATMRVGTHSSVLEQLAEVARDEADYAELARIAMEDKTLLTVEAGNALLELGRTTEEKGLAQVYRAVRGRPLAEGDRARAIGEVPQRCITAAGPQVIGWGTWSAYFGRHLLHQMTADEMHTRHMLGMPAAADEKGKGYDALYGSVPQYSFLQDRRESHAGIRPTRFAESIGYTIDQPERVTAFNFFVTEDLATKEVIRRGPAARAAWFAPPLPRGTTFDFRMRWQALGFEPKAEALEGLRVISPRDPTVLGALGADHPKGWPVSDLEKRLGPRIDYDVTLLRTLAGAAGDDREQLGLVNRRLCGVGARWCGALGVFLAEEGRDDAAAAELQKTFDAAADRVGATYYAPWLVRYYTDRRQWEKATAVAEEAASVGSGSGLLARRMLLERRGRFGEAEATLLQIRARYGDDAHADPPEEDDDDALIAFYHRMANVRGDPGYSERFRTLSTRAFPAGVEKLDPAALTPDAARDGVAILKESGTTRRVGLKPGDVIVGVDGHRVRTARQYAIARLFSETPEMRLHVWRYPGFREINVRTWWRWLDTDLRTNVPGEPSTPG